MANSFTAFRDQDFADLPIKEALNFGGYFGRHHIHPTSGGPEGHPEVHLVHRGTDDTTARDFFEERTNSVTWHSDVTYEKQPPGTTFLYCKYHLLSTSLLTDILTTYLNVVLDGPAAGGDTLFVNQAAAYRRLSPEFRKRLHGLQAVHSGNSHLHTILSPSQHNTLTTNQASNKPRTAYDEAASPAASPRLQSTPSSAHTT